MDFGSSKQKELGEEGSLMMPLVDFESLWKTHPSLPPGFSKEQEEVQPERPWMPGTPVKPRPSMDMDNLWKNHPSLPPGFAGFSWMGNEKEESPDSQNVSPLANMETGDSGKVDCESGGQVTEDNLIDLEDVGYGSSNKGIDTWDASLASISFTELLGLASSAAAAPSDDTTPLHTPHLTLFPDSQESSVVNPGSNQWSNTKNTDGAICNYHRQNQNEHSSPTIGLVSTAESKQNARSSDGVACANMELVYSPESIPLQNTNTAAVGIASSVESILTHEKGSKKKIDLNRKPRQQKPKKKKHRPKVVVDDDGKKKKIPKSKSKPPKVTPKTPKPSTPKPEISKKTRRGKKKTLSSEAAEEPPTKSCKKGLNFELENLLTQDIYAQTDQNVNKITHQYLLRNTNRSWKWRFDLNLEFQYDDESSYENEVNKRENGVRGEMNMVHSETRDLKNAVDKEGEVCLDCNSTRVYGRIFRRDRCLSNSKKMGPVFPKIYKRKRSQRRRRQAIMCFITTKAACQTASPSSVIRRKKRSNLFTPRRNFASLIAIPICNQLPGNHFQFGERQKKIIPLEKGRVPMRVTDTEDDKNCMVKSSPTSTTPSRHSSKKSKKKRKRPTTVKQPNINGQEQVVVDSLIQKLELLSISDKSNQLVCYQAVKPAAKSNQLVRYQAKKPAPKVHLDVDTLKMWNLLVVQNRSDGAKEEMDKEDERRWEEEREVFNGRVKSFLACMHLLQGDRRFQPWKGSVLDSVVGVFLTQNVSDKLSSSAFMTLAALFPLPSTRNDSASYLVEEDEEYEEEDCQTRDQIHFVSATNLKANMTRESNPCGRESSTSSWEQCNEIARGETENQSSNEGKKEKNNDKEDNSFDWDSLRRFYSKRGRKSRIHTNDSLDWEAIRHANVSNVAKAISVRGMNNVLAARIKDFLDRLVRDHGRLDLEWLRDVPPEKAKDYLLSIRGLGLKSVECVRLLTLHHHAFPVDTNVGRITVRLGWVPLQPLPSDVYLHSLDQYPPMDTIQKYLWPRLCTLDQKTLYELHYQMITFGKVFCTKKNPYCNACPLRGECKHYASALASRLPLIKNGVNEELVLSSPIENHSAALKEEGIPSYMHLNPVVDNPVLPISVTILEDGLTFQSEGKYENYEPIIEIPASPEPKYEPLEIEEQEKDIENLCEEDYDEIPTFRLVEEFGVGEQDCPCTSSSIQEGHVSQALVSVVSSIPARKLKYISRLRTEHQVYVLPDSHRLLIERGMRRESCDPCPFLLAIWSPGETVDSFEQPQRRCNSEGSRELCKDETCSFCNAAREQNSQTIRGTLLIPCRTAMRGHFPLNGTYFQVNEVFADDESSRNPIIVPREEIWNLPRRIAYFGTSTTSIFRGLSITEIRDCFWQGFICVRGFNQKTRAPKPLARRLHITPSHMGKAKTVDDEE